MARNRWEDPALTALTSTSKGLAVRTPHFVLDCPNCSGTVHIRAAASTDGRPEVRFTMRCTGDCRADETVRVPVRPQPKETPR